MNAPASVFEYKGDQYVVVYSAGNLFAKSPPGDSVWLFSLNGTIDSVSPPLKTEAAQVSLEGADTKMGGEIYARICAACHGDAGEGGHGGGPSIAHAMEPGYIISVVTNGGENMPPFSTVLDSTEVRDVTVFVREQLQDSGR